MPRLCHFEILASDPERAIAFYTAVFDWQFHKAGGPDDYWSIRTGLKQENGISGGLLRSSRPIQIQKGGVPSAFVCYILVDSVEAYLKKVKDGGGMVLGDKTSVPGFGWFAPCLDSEGNHFSLFEADISQSH